MLEEKLLQLERTYPFHMPGHKRALSFPNPYALDITEIGGFDNLHHPTGILLQAQKDAAQLYGSHRAYYLVNGSTCGLLAAISAAVPFGAKVLLARNCHQAVYHALYLRRLTPVYVYPASTRAGLQGQIRAEDIAQALAQEPDISAVILTSPTYDGVVSDIAAIAALVHAHGLPLIVDAAHGAHFGFHPAFPPSPVRLGADAVIVSVHKTLPAFTQTALLHLCSDRIDASRVERFLAVYETSSPSYVLMAGIERALSIVRQDGGKLFSAYAARLARFREAMRALSVLSVLGASDFSAAEAYAFDEGKLLIKTGKSMTGQQLLSQLRTYGLELEMAGGDYATALTSIMDTDEGFARLGEALLQIDRSCVPKQSPVFETETLYRRQEQAMPFYEAWDADCEYVPLSAAGGRICANTIALYPPGIPILVPGERISEETAALLQTCVQQGYQTEGLRGDAAACVKRPCGT